MLLGSELVPSTCADEWPCMIDAKIILELLRRVLGAGVGRNDDGWLG